MLQRLLILTSYKSVSAFQRRVDNRTLLWGLDQANIGWQLVQPWKELPDLDRFDAVFSSLYLPAQNNFPFHAQRVERVFRESGRPVIQSAEHITTLHSYFLERWRDAGVPCADFCHFDTVEDITVPYPLILRKDGQHRGRSMFFARDAGEAARIIDRQRQRSLSNPATEFGPQPLDLAIAFVDTRGRDGFYEKWRCYVVGDTIIPAHYLRSKSRFVNYKDANLDPQTCAIDRAYLADDIPHAGAIRAAAATGGFPIITLDYSYRPDGSIVFWEGNRQRGTAGDTRIRWLGVRPADMLYGRTVARFIQSRLGVATS